MVGTRLKLVTESMSTDRLTGNCDLSNCFYLLYYNKLVYMSLELGVLVG